MKVYTYKKCDACRKAVKWLKAQDIAFEEVPIREIPPTKVELKKMLAHLDGEMKKLFNTSGADYREMDLKDRLPEMTEAESMTLLSEKGNLVKRPFALTETSGTVGFKEDVWKKKFAK